MFNCGFGDAFRINMPDRNPLYVDFGIHSLSLSEKKTDCYNYVLEDMISNEESSFLLTHYHLDHYSGLIYAIKNGYNVNFKRLYVPCVWDEDCTDIVSLLLLSDMAAGGGDRINIIDLFIAICKIPGKLILVSEGARIEQDFVALWPNKESIKKKASDSLGGIWQSGVYTIEGNFVEVRKLADDLIKVVNNIVTISANGEDKSSEINSLNDLQRRFREIESILRIEGNDTLNLNEFGNHVSIVMHNIIDSGCNNILFTGDADRTILKKIEGRRLSCAFSHALCCCGLGLHDKYQIIKVPHHGTKAYYFDFTKYIIPQKTTLLIPNGDISKWGIDPSYEYDASCANVYSTNNECVLKWKNKCQSCNSKHYTAKYVSSLELRL